MANTFWVNLPMKEAALLIDKAVVEGSVTGEQIDSYTISGPEDTTCLVTIYEKHYYRAGNRLTLTVIVDDMEGSTRVHTISGGGGEGFFRFDWGASDSFEEVAWRALEQFAIRK